MSSILGELRINLCCTRVYDQATFQGRDRAHAEQCGEDDHQEGELRHPLGTEQPSNL